MAANVIKPTIGNTNINGDATTQELSNAYSLNNSVDRLDSRPSFDGQLDKNGDIRLRIAYIDNPEITRQEYQKIDPLNTKTIFNNNTGKLTLRWVDLPGGVIKPSTLGGSWTYNIDNDSELPENREYSEWDITSRREMVSLTHPFIWQSENNYCGLNYIPPVGSLVIVGFRKHGLPVILGYLPTHYKVCYPVLKPGEMVMKGYGNNYTHWRWSDKLDMKAWCVKDEIDIDNPQRDTAAAKKNDVNCTLWIRLNANDRSIILSALETDPPPFKAHQSHQSQIIITPKYLRFLSHELYDNDTNSPTHKDKRWTWIGMDEVNTCIRAYNQAEGNNRMTQILTSADDISLFSGNSSLNTSSSISINPLKVHIDTSDFSVNCVGPVTIKGASINLN